jgi:hypothetical protein
MRTRASLAILLIVAHSRATFSAVKKSFDCRLVVLAVADNALTAAPASPQVLYNRAERLASAGRNKEAHHRHAQISEARPECLRRARGARSHLPVELEITKPPAPAAHPSRPIWREIG